MRPCASGAGRPSRLPILTFYIRTSKKRAHRSGANKFPFSVADTLTFLGLAPLRLRLRPASSEADWMRVCELRARQYSRRHTGSSAGFQPLPDESDFVPGARMLMVEAADGALLACMRWRDTLAGIEAAHLDQLIDPAVWHRGHFGYLDRWASERSARPLLARMVLFKGVYQLGLGTGVSWLSLNTMQGLELVYRQLGFEHAPEVGTKPNPYILEHFSEPACFMVRDARLPYRDRLGWALQRFLDRDTPTARPRDIRAMPDSRSLLPAEVRERLLQHTKLREAA